MFYYYLNYINSKIKLLLTTNHGAKLGEIMSQKWPPGHRFESSALG